MNNLILNLEYAIYNKKEGLYIVEDKETIDDIASKFNTTKQLIISQNFLKEEINKGDYLYIKCYNNIYTVTILDTIDSIANKFNLPKEKILKDNKINYVYPTQKIIINYD